jgi:hypothetical protein
VEELAVAHTYSSGYVQFRCHRELASKSTRISRHGRIPLCNPILKWPDDFNVHGTLVKNSVGPGRSMHTSEIIEILQNAQQQGSLHSAR